MGEKKVALITGAARGIGKATAERLCTDGYFTINIDNFFESTFFPPGHSLTYDVKEESAIIYLFRTVEMVYGRLDVLVNNAGVHLNKVIDEISVDEFDYLVAVNMRAPFLCTRQAMPFLRKTRGVIINVASGVG